MRLDNRLFRSFVAAFTGVWTSVLCCCAVTGHTTAAPADQAAETAAAAADDDHACCAPAPQPATPAQPTDEHSKAPHDGACDCPHQSTLKATETEHNALPPATTQPLAPELAPPAIHPVTPDTAEPAALHQSHAPPVPPCAQTLLQQSCLLTT